MAPPAKTLFAGGQKENHEVPSCKMGKGLTDEKGTGSKMASNDSSLLVVTQCLVPPTLNRVEMDIMEQ